MSFLDCSRNRCHKENKSSKKIVVRRLPPNFTFETFTQQVSPLPIYNYIYFVGASRRDGINHFSRIYINFVHHEDIFLFKEKYDNYVFLGPKGLEYPAVVEFAPFQKIPKNRIFQKHDVKSGAIYNNYYYHQFIKSINAPRIEFFEKPVYDLQLKSQTNKQDFITPLLKYVAAKKCEQMKYRADKKKDARYIKNDNSMVFVNSSIRKNGHHEYRISK